MPKIIPGFFGRVSKLVFLIVLQALVTRWVPVQNNNNNSNKHYTLLQ